MLSKEEIVRKHYENKFKSQKYDGSVNKNMNQDYFFPAMDEYAKQEAIEFGEFLLNKVNENCAVRDKDENLVWEGDSGVCLTTSQLYQLFINSKTK